jgi:hypothetical protein
MEKASFVKESGGLFSLIPVAEAFRTQWFFRKVFTLRSLRSQRLTALF